MPAPLVSVIVPCFNGAEFVREALASAVEQTYPAVEIIVVDDGSVDDSVEVASAFAGVKVISQPNQGVAVARNVGIRESSGEFLVFLDHDDRLLPSALETGVRCAEESPEHSFVFGLKHRILPDGFVFEPDSPQPPELTYRDLLLGRALVPPAVALFRRAPVEAVGGFDPALRLAQDYDLYLKIARIAPARCHNELVAEYRKHDEQRSHRVARTLAATLMVLDAQEEHVRHDDDLADALARGRRAWQRLFGQWLPVELLRSLARGKFADAAQAMMSLLRNAPASFAGAWSYAIRRMSRKT